jgi:protein O-mannosyl-transferase
MADGPRAGATPLNRLSSDVRRLLAVAACAMVVYAGALWNRFAMDDLYIIVYNRALHDADALGRAFTLPYWPPELGGKMYRPLVSLSFAFDWITGSAAWYHAVNLLWHAGASVAVAVLARRWAGSTAGLLAGLLFAVHPVHVEAVANVVGRAELMAAAFTVLAVYAAVARDRVWWSAVALALGLLSKENAAVAPGLIVWAWLLGMGRPPRRRMAAYAASWVAIAALYGVARYAVVHQYAWSQALAQVFYRESPLTIRLTAVAALADAARLLLFPLHLRADYSPAERTAIHSPLDTRLLIGLVVAIAWGALLYRCWRRGRTIEAFGLGWMALAYLPVANLLFPSGVYMAERTLYLPSVGLALAAAAALGKVPLHRWRTPVAAVLLLAAVRTVLRVPVWRDDLTLTESILDDSPRSYKGPAHYASIYLSRRDPARARQAYHTAVTIYDRDFLVWVGAADAAYTLGHLGEADSLLVRANQICFGCAAGLRIQAQEAAARGDSATATFFLRRADQWQHLRDSL